MSPPISIDGTDIAGATIDGQDVSEITVDGDTVFTAIPDSGLLQYRYEDDSDTTTAIDRIGANDGSINGPTYDASSFAGDFALNFASASDYVEIPASDLIPADGDFTIISAVNPSVLTSDERRTIISNNNGQAGRWDFYASLDGSPGFFADNLSSLLTMSAIPTDSYTVLAVRRDGDTWDLIRDDRDGTGASVEDTITESATLDTSVNYYLGRNVKQLSNQEPLGSQDEVYIDSTALSLSRIEDYPFV